MAGEVSQGSRSRRQQERARRVARVLGWAGVAVVLMVYGPTVWSVLFPEQVSKTSPVKFDSRMWKDVARGSADATVRARMLDDLLGSHALVGRTLTDAYELLGQPDSASWSDQYPFPAYRMGPRTTSAFDSSERPLILVHDREGLIVRVFTPR